LPDVLRIELDRDGFEANSPIVIDRRVTRIAFTVDNRTGDAHPTAIRLALPPGFSWEVRANGRRAALQSNASTDYPLRVEVANSSGKPVRVEILARRLRHPGA
jgi:hypothetical protein